MKFTGALKLDSCILRFADATLLVTSLAIGGEECTFVSNEFVSNISTEFDSYNEYLVR